MNSIFFQSPFILVDQNYDCIAVTVFNLLAGKGFNAGDAIAIPEPYIQETNVTLKNGEVSRLLALLKCTLLIGEEL